MAIEIELRNIIKRFGNYIAVDNVSLTVHPGEFVCLLGPSGCGKTTTLRLIAGLEQPDAGSIYFNGEEVEKLRVYERNTAMVFQNYALFPHKTVQENIIFGPRMRKMDPAVIQERLKWAMELVSISGMEDRFPNQLSGGQQQRVALARAIVYEPDVLLLDEPLSALDKKLRDQMRFELKRIQQKVGVTTIFVTHDQEEAMAMADRIVIMDRARIVQEGAPDEIYMRPQNLYVANFLGISNIFAGISETVEGRKCLRLQDGAHINIPFETKEGEQTRVSLRPQSFSFDRADKHDCALTVRYVDGSYLGTNIRYLVEYGGETMYIETLNSEVLSPIRQYRAGDAVEVYFSSQNLIKMEN